MLNWTCYAALCAVIIWHLHITTMTQQLVCSGRLIGLGRPFGHCNCADFSRGCALIELSQRKRGPSCPPNHVNIRPHFVANGNSNQFSLQAAAGTVKINGKASRGELGKWKNLDFDSLHRRVKELKPTTTLVNRLTVRQSRFLSSFFRLFLVCRYFSANTQSTHPLLARIEKRK